MTSRKPNGWQIILADLALILFLVTLAGFIAVRGKNSSAAQHVQTAALQGVFRPGPAASLTDWLAMQDADGRMRLTIFARYDGERNAAIWENAQTLAAEANSAGINARVVLERGRDSDLYAAFAYDDLALNAAD